jgi:hypothetical protein
MKTITIQVKDETADKIEQLPEDKRKQLSKLVEIWVSAQKLILQVMEELGEYAKKQGLTKDKLDDLLKDE